MGTAVALRSAHVHVCSRAQACVSEFMDMWHGADILCGSLWMCNCVSACLCLKRQLGLRVEAGVLVHTHTLPVSPSQPCYLWLALFS